MTDVNYWEQVKTAASHLRDVLGHAASTASEDVSSASHTVVHETRQHLDNLIAWVNSKV